MFFTFSAGTDVDTAQVQIQNKLQQALPQLPEAVQRQGLQVNNSVENSFMVIAFYSENNGMTSGEISDYVASNILDPLGRVQGVGSTTLYGGQNAMRIWCNPEKMRQFELNPADIAVAVRAQNAQVAGGQTGAGPALPGQQTSFTVTAANRLETVDDFKNIQLRVEENGSILRLEDVARIELDEESFMGSSWFDGHPCSGVAVRLASGANVLATTAAIKKEIASLARFFPVGLKYAYAEDRAPIVEKSIMAVTRTLLESIVLVIAVMFCFLQRARVTVIPTIAVPVVLLGVFTVLSICGYSINTLTMFGLILAIGLLVDDAIVVVENVERLMQSEGLSPYDAAVKSMHQITGALIGVAAVISAVFVPMAFMEGSTGVIYRQFSITIVSAMILSVIVAIILSPMLCATFLAGEKPVRKRHFFIWFNHIFTLATNRYADGVNRMLHTPYKWIAAYLFVLGGCIGMYLWLPKAFLPEEDQGILYVDVQLPPGSSFERTEKILAKIDSWFRTEEKDSVQSVFCVMGWGFNGTGQDCAMVFPMLKDWNERGKGQSSFDIMKRASEFFGRIPEAEIFVMSPPAVMELGNSSGFDMELMDRNGRGHDILMMAKDILLKNSSKYPEIAYARYGGQDDSRQYELAINTEKAGALQLDKGTINNAISSYWGGEYINDFSDKGRTKKVYLQADPAFRVSGH